MTQPRSSKSDDPPGNSDRTNCKATAVIGIGSPHGEDAAGWEVIDAVEQLLSKTAGPTTNRVCLRKAIVPYDVLDWLETAAVVHLIDASLDATPGVRQFWVQATSGGDLQLTRADQTADGPHRVSFPQTQSRSSHQLDLSSILQLAAALGRLTTRLALWTVSVESTDKRQSMSQATQARIDHCAKRIVRELEQVT